MTPPTQGRMPLWRQIYQCLSDEIDEGLYPPGAKLPTEAELSQRFDVNRHTVRRALEALREDGRIHVRRGSGAYVMQGRFEYPIAPRTRLSTNLAAQGIAANREWLRMEEVSADRRDARMLGIAEGDPVLVSECLGQADGVPISYARSVFPLARLPGMAGALAEAKSITRALARVGVEDYERIWTRLTAERPGALIARHLKMNEINPVLLSESLNASPDGTLVEYGQTWFCSERVQLVIDPRDFAQPAVASRKKECA